MRVSRRPKTPRKTIVYLTRTDFLLQFVWKPPKPEDLAQDAGSTRNQAQGRGSKARRG